MKLVIIGGVAGGATAAARARRLDEHAQIVILERGEHVSFANCGLPYYIGESIAQRESLLVSTPEALMAKYNLEVRVLSEVVAIDRQAKAVTVKDLRSGALSQETYDKLILSPGAEPLRPPLPGIDLPGVYSLRSIPDSDRIKEAVDQGGARRAVVVGGGFIGLEMAHNLVERGVAVTLVEALDQLMPPLDREMAAAAHQTVLAHGIDLRLSTKISGFAPAPDGGLSVSTEGGGAIACDLAILSVGVRPENALAKAAGLKLGPRGHIVVDQTMRASDPHIYAVGDAVQIWDFITGQSVATALAGPANRQGRIAADNALGRRTLYRGSMGTAVVKLFDQTIACTGAAQKTLTQNGVPHLVSYSHSPSHATYYPGAETLLIKLVFAPGSGRLLGAQVVGGDGVDKRIDVLATAIRAGMTVFDLEELDLAYAPPYGSARDPVNVAGMVAANRLRGDVEVILPPDLDQMDPERDVLIDLRFPEELEETGAIPGARLIPLPLLRQALPGLDKSKRYLVFCAIGLRGYLGYRIMIQHGFEVVNLGGGYSLWQQWQA